PARPDVVGVEAGGQPGAGAVHEKGPGRGGECCCHVVGFEGVPARGAAFAVQGDAPGPFGVAVAGAAGGDVGDGRVRGEPVFGVAGLARADAAEDEGAVRGRTARVDDVAVTAG